MSEVLLDLRGEECPAPLVKVARTLAKISDKTLIVLTDIKECVKLIRETVESIGSYNVDVQEDKGYWKIIVRARTTN